MAQLTRTLLQLRNAIRQRADMSGSTGPDQFVPDDEVTQYANASLAEFYEIVTETNENYFLTSSIFTVTNGGSGNNVVPLPDTCYKVRGLDRSYTNNSNDSSSWYDVYRFDFHDRNLGNNPYFPIWFPMVTRYGIRGDNLVLQPSLGCDGVYQLWFYPTPPVLVNDSDTFDARQYWWEYVVVDGAIKCKDKQESDVSVLAQTKLGLQERIRSMARNRDYGEPVQVGRRKRRGGWDNNGFGGFGDGGGMW